MRARDGSITALTAFAALALAGCSSTVSGVAVPENVAIPGGPATVVPAPGGAAAPSSSASASPSAPSSSAQSAPIVLPDNGNGYTFMATKSGRTHCRVSAGGAGCQLTFATPGPRTENGDAANGVNVGRDGELTYVLGDIGVANPVTLEYRTYTARGWTIVASYEGTRFTNDTTGHGMVVNTSGAQAF